jgi:electron transport complex protein RnfG
MDTPNGLEAGGAPSAPDTAARQRAVRGSAAAVLAIAVLTLALIALANSTRTRVEANQQSRVIAGLDALLPPGTYDNELLRDKIVVTAPELLGTTLPTTIYRARRQGRPVAAVLRPVAPDGYRGAIELLVAIDYDGTLIGVQVLHHNETPGLGNAFETRDRAWLEAFRGLSLTHPPQQRWSVRKDGGDFDAFTGATITPRAIVKAVRRSLEYFHAQRDTIFAVTE